MISPFKSTVIAACLGLDPLCVIDVGAAGGIDPIWLRHGPNEHLRFFGFEPNPSNYEKLTSDSTTQYFPIAIADQRGVGDLHALSTLSSLSRRTDREDLFGERYETIRVEIETLEHLRDSGVIPSLDVIKVDIEEHDLAAIRGIGRYISHEPLYIKSEFHFYRSIPLSNFSGIDDFLAKNGFWLFGLQLKNGSCGELAGGDLMYLRSVNHLLASPGDVKEKHTAILKLIAICFYIRNPQYAYIVARKGADAGVLSRPEVDDIVEVIEKRVFLPSILPKFWAGQTITDLLAVLCQILAGKAWAEKIGARHNRLEQYAPLFIRKCALPRFLRRSYRRVLDERYERFVKRSGKYYDSALQPNHAEGRSRLIKSEDK